MFRRELRKLADDEGGAVKMMRTGVVPCERRAASWPGRKRVSRAARCNAICRPVDKRHVATVKHSKGERCARV